mmetsp:Transcript_93596/g.195122  ORF Transcript_93596/g.195122 Transcript_93596/m.195122 type:complete len:213 (+) Transcript_93596:528-1166(+)
MTNWAARLRVLRGVLVAIAILNSAAALLEGPADGVGAAQGHDALVVEAHAVEDVAQVGGGILGTTTKGSHGIGQASIASSASRLLLGAGTAVRSLNSAILHGDLGATSHLDGASRCHLDQVGPGDTGELGLDRFQVLQALGKSSIGTVVDLRLKADGPVGASASRPLGDALVVVAAVVPGQADHDGGAVLLADELSEGLLAGDILLDLARHL